MTSLHYAAIIDALDLATLLIDKGAIVDATENNVRTILSFAFIDTFP